MLKKISLITFLLAIISSYILSQSNPLYKDLSVHFKGDAKIEVGGYYAGIEIHHSSPIPQRISFYYPSANSLDLSTDYWKRDTSFIMQCGLKIDNNNREKIGAEPYEYSLTPYTVEFLKADKIKSVKISYHFAKNKPALIIKYELKNNSDKTAEFEFDTKTDNTLKTCHTYNTILPSACEKGKENGTLYYHYNQETQNAVMFIANSGLAPVQYDTSAKFIYRKILAPSEKMIVTLIMGTCKEKEEIELTDYLIKNYEKEINEYENEVLKKAYSEKVFETGDKVLDHSVHWSKALLETNRHYIDGKIMPMPCPAEYNFYFTHDVLLTDLAAVNFDLERMKEDLKFITSHASEDKNIPHAYYWKDNKFVTEPADNANWNHFWFIIASASYLRHSHDVEFAEFLYPYVTKSLTETLQNKRDDDLMWAYRPDWWDIGKNWGPRAFMTILAVQSLRDYLYMSTVLNKNHEKLSEYETTANRMQTKLVSKLWDEKQKYLINFLEDGSKDEHYYIGSLLASHFNILDKQKKIDLIETAKKNLLDEKIGIYTAYPMDFHKLSNLWKFNGNEAGDEYFYINGGIWPHGNSWYSLALIAANKKAEALEFVKKCMSLDGIINSPNGQPAMYEYRNGKKTDPAIYGQIDKPQFMWASGWYMYSMYHLFGIRENNWNLELNPFMPDKMKAYKFSMNSRGKSVLINVTGKGERVNEIIYDGKACPSIVIPANISNLKSIKLKLGKVMHPYLSKIDAELVSCSYENNSINIKACAFAKHKSDAEIISKTKPGKVFVDGKELTNGFNVIKKNNCYITTINFEFAEKFAEIKVVF